MLTDSVSLALAALAAGLATAVVWMRWPRRDTLDGLLWHQVIVATLLRGWTEGSGADADAWYEATKAAVPRKSGAVDVDAAWAEDPIALGPLYDPAQLFGADVSWDALAAWGEGKEHVAQRLDAAIALRWMGVGSGRNDDEERLLGAWEREGLKRVDAVDDEDALVHGLMASSERDPGLPLVVVTVGEAVDPVLRALVSHPGLRDEVAAVVAINADFDAPERAAWMTEHFTQARLETDVVRWTPYLSLQWSTSGADAPRPSSFPEPKDDAGLRTAEVVDLGAVRVDAALPDWLTPRAVRWLVSGWLLCRR